MGPYIRALMEDGLDQVLAQEDEDIGKWTLLFHNEPHRLSNQKNFVYLAEIGD